MRILLETRGMEELNRAEMMKFERDCCEESERGSRDARKMQRGPSPTMRNPPKLYWLLSDSPTAAAGKSSATRANRVCPGAELSNPTMCWCRFEPARN